MPLTFDEQKHEYTYDGEIIPSVTAILKDVGLIDTSRYYGSEARNIGTEAHWWIAIDTRGELDQYDPPPDRVLGHIESAREFRKLMNLSPELIEQPIIGHGMQYAGTLDLTGWANWRPKPASWLYDYKTGEEEDWHSYQTQAYASAIAWNRPVNDESSKWFPPMHRGCVYLNENGKVGQLVEHTNDERDERVWLAAVTLFHAKPRRNGR